MEIINKVAQSGIITIDLEEFYPKGERVLLDIKDQLFQGLILREKDFREFVKNENWSKYNNKFVAITCTTDAIVPTWAYMLLAIHLQPFAKKNSIRKSGNTRNRYLSRTTFKNKYH